jgi:hypothetical protein
MLEGPFLMANNFSSLVLNENSYPAAFNFFSTSKRFCPIETLRIEGFCVGVFSLSQAVPNARMVTDANRVKRCIWLNVAKVSSVTGGADTRWMSGGVSGSARGNGGVFWGADSHVCLESLSFGDRIDEGQLERRSIAGALFGRK